MSYEVEVKYRLVDHDQLEKRLIERGAVHVSTVVHEDIYLRHPARDFAQTNEALRLRKIGRENRITFKGPRRSGPTKTREEIEIPLADGEEVFLRLSRLFEVLGFEPIARVRKSRMTYRLHQGPHEIEVALDVALGLGQFAEIETQAATDADLPAAQTAVLELADQLGLTEVEPRSYLRMIMEASQQGLYSVRPAGEEA